MPRKNKNTLNHWEPYENKKFILKEQNIEKNYKDLVSKSLDTRNRAKNMRLRFTP